MYDRILVAVDHSELSDRAVLAARDIDIIVMGSRGRSDLTSFILGSTAHKVMHLADRPVLVIR
jgi:nucleotide-binding universal stress UspA family protein